MVCQNGHRAFGRLDKVVDLTEFGLFGDDVYRLVRVYRPTSSGDVRPRSGWRDMQLCDGDRFISFDGAAATLVRYGSGGVGIGTLHTVGDTVVVLDDQEVLQERGVVDYLFFDDAPDEPWRVPRTVVRAGEYLLEIVEFESSFRLEVNEGCGGKTLIAVSPYPDGFDGTVGPEDGHYVTVRLRHADRRDRGPAWGREMKVKGGRALLVDTEKKFMRPLDPGEDKSAAAACDGVVASHKALMEPFHGFEEPPEDEAYPNLRLRRELRVVAEARPGSVTVDGLPAQTWGWSRERDLAGQRFWVSNRSLELAEGPHRVAVEVEGETWTVAAQVESSAMDGYIEVARPAQREPPPLPPEDEMGGPTGELLVGLEGTEHPFDMVVLSGGTFLMGSPQDEAGRNDDETLHEVTLTRPFAISRTEVTQAQYEFVMGENPSRGEYREVSLLGADFPVQNVSWFDAIRFCNTLSEREGLTPAYRIDGEVVRWDREADGYRLPTEAEWEYAARAGTRSLYAGTSDPEEVCEYGNVVDASARSMFGWVTAFECDDGVVGLASVGAYRLNPWGLADMTGNLWEWVWDWYQFDLQDSLQENPEGSSVGSYRVIRSGSWLDLPVDARVANRFWWSPSSRGSNLGFRPARSLPSAL
ncbi:MAG: SUMF1/EgtB/PvdO family nonheme iron enzyme [Alphaproteobacteria bacterium]|nr:SUMF1/EgtB/PvdO family nonheme iron enzyme [Alphaproteobacteria bacterium]